MGVYDSHNLFPYDNDVVELKLKDQLITKLDMYQFATADNSLTEAAGNLKKIRTYIGTGYAEDVEMGEGNTQDIGAGYIESDYRVKFTQARFPYFDEQIQADPAVIEAGLKRMTVSLTNDMTAKVVRELNNATIVKNVSAWGFDAIAEAEAMFPEEINDGKFLLVNRDVAVAIKKDCKEVLSYVEAFVRHGYVGNINSIPIYVSDAVPACTGFLATPEAVRIFWKQNLGVEQYREPNTRKTEVYSRFCNVVALVNADKVVKLVAPTTFVPVAKDANAKVSMTDTNGYKVVGKNVTAGFTDNEFGTVTGDYTLIEIPACLSVGSHHIKQVNPALSYFYGTDPSITKDGDVYTKEKDYTISTNPDAFKFMMGAGKSVCELTIDGKKYTFNGNLAFAE